MGSVGRSNVRYSFPYYTRTCLMVAFLGTLSISRCCNHCSFGYGGLMQRRNSWRDRGHFFALQSCFRANNGSLQSEQSLPLEEQPRPHHLLSRQQQLEVLGISRPAHLTHIKRKRSVLSLETDSLIYRAAQSDRVRTNCYSFDRCSSERRPIPTV
jgi:hypothetical protein